MPKVYLTEADRKRAEAEKRFAEQDYDISHLLYNHLRDNHITQAQLAVKAQVGTTMVQKAIKKPGELQVKMLRKIFAAAGLDFTVAGSKL